MPPAHDVRGIQIDSQIRCAHYHSQVDIIAIKMHCCGIYYACKDCHDALANHSIAVWPRDQWDEKAILCGNCGSELSINAYLQCENQCPHCESKFNPGCRNHYHFYFESETRSGVHG